MSAAEQIYLSYSRYETEFALKLATDLKNAGVNIWCDRLRMSSGDDLLATLKEAIKKSSTLICVLSGTYLQAQYARYEWEHARKKGKTLLPIMAGSLDPRAVPPELGLRRAIDFSNWRDESAYAASFARLLRLFGNIPEALRPDLTEQHLNRLIGQVETRLANAESLDPPDQVTSQTARMKLRPMSSLDPVWGTIGDVRVTHGTDELPQGALVPLNQITQQFHRFVLTGAGGSGKSTILNRLAINLAYAYRASAEDAWMPLLADLALWEPDEPFLDFLSRSWIAGDDVSEAVKLGTVMLILDGLNDLRDMAQIEQLRHALATELADAGCIIACRSPNYHSQYELDLPSAELLPLSDSHIREIVLAQLGAGSRTFLSQVFAHTEELTDDTPLLALARNPLHLQGLIFLHRSSPQNHLPETLGALYKRLLPATWVWWRLSQTQMSVSYRELVPSLASLALNMLDNGSSALTLNQAGMVLFDPALLAVRAARSVRLMTVADGYVKFAHSLLRDYYASLHLTPLDVTMRLQSPQFAQDGERLQGRWDSVIEIMSGVQPATDNLVRTVAEIDPFLAAQCLGAGARVTPGVRSMVLDGLLNEVDEPAKHPAIRRALTALSVDQTLPTAIERLRFGSDGLKSAAVWAVKEFHVPLPLALLKALKDWDWTPNEHAAAVLQKAPQWDETIAAFINILDDSNPDRRRGAAWALGVLADRAAAPALREALKDNQQSVRDMAAKALRQIEQRYPESAAPVPAPAVRSAATPAVRTKAPLVGPPSAPLPKPVQTAASARERLTRQTGETRRATQNSDQTGPNLQDLLRKLTFPDWGDRREAVRQLGELGTQDVVMPLLESLHDSDDQVRFAAVQALSQFSDDNVRQALLEVLADESDVVACAAADVLTRFTPAPVHELLAIVMKLDHPPEMRGIAIEALGTIGDPLAEPVLIESLNDETPLRMEGQRICDLAADALEKLGTETALAAAAEWRHEQQPTQPLRPVEEPSDLLSFVAADEELDTTRQADEPIVALMQAFRTASLHDQHDASLALRDHARSLRGLDTQRALVALANGLRDGDPIIRWASVQGLAWLQDENAIPYLHESLHDRHFTVRLAAIRALQEINDRNAVWALLERLRDDNALIREKAAEALGRLGDESVAVRLTDALYDDEPFVRHAAAVSLGVIGSAYAVDALIDAVQNDELMVCLAAVESLGKIGDAKAVPVIEPLLDDTNKPLWDERRVCDIAADALRLIARQVPEAGAALARWQERQGASHA